jgi:hypothetical protein
VRHASPNISAHSAGRSIFTRTLKLIRRRAPSVRPAVAVAAGSTAAERD